MIWQIEYWNNEIQLLLCRKELCKVVELPFSKLRVWSYDENLGSFSDRKKCNPDLTSAPASARTKDVIPPVWTLFGSCWNTAQIRCQVALLLGSVCFLLGSGCAKILGHLKFHLSQKGICLWYVVTQFVVEDKSPFLVSMIHASRNFWTNCFFCVVRYPDIWDYAGSLRQGVPGTVFNKVFATSRQRKTPRNPRLSMRNIRDEQGETPLMEACGPDDCWSTPGPKKVSRDAPMDGCILNILHLGHDNIP